MTKKNTKAIDRIGQKFGKLTVLSIIPFKGKKPFANCLCDCGNPHYARVDSIVDGRIKSCGCLVSDHLITHGMSKHPLFAAWRSMNKRCTSETDKSYENYGGRGIYVCDEWKLEPNKFIEWSEANGWKKGLQIDRIDNNGPYSPENCRFVTLAENCAAGRRRGPRKATDLPVGVYYSKPDKKYKAQIYKDGKQFHLGYFLTIEEASSAYQTALEAFQEERLT